jgi:small multidrug resistance family-3 protein
MPTLFLYPLAAIAEIGGCYAFWAWARLGRSPLWLIPGIVALLLFAWLLTCVPTDAAGRAFAAYGGVYIVASVAWLWLMDGVRPDRSDALGAVIALAGAAIILFGAHHPPTISR